MTPCYGGVCNVSYTICLINTIELLKFLNIEVTVEFCRNDSSITRARNNLIGKAINDLSVTHFLFIDSDLSCNPKDIVSLIDSDKEIIGRAYQIKNYIWPDISSEFLTSISTCEQLEFTRHKKLSYTDLIRSKIVKYNLNYLDSKIVIDNNLMKVRHIASGFMMIK